MKDFSALIRQLPRHVAIVMDGNGRWATQRKLPRIAGHRAGAKVVQDIVKYSGEIGIEVLSLFAFSVENRLRPIEEVKFLMNLLRHSLQRNTIRLHENNVRLKIIGDRQYYDEKLLIQIESSEALTARNSGLTLVIAINYSGRWDIAQATQKMLQTTSSSATVAEVSQELSKNLAFSELPDPDLFIRTSGEQRISNFMLWQLAYSEIYFTDVYWPDFTKLELERAIRSFQMRERRFGLTPEQVGVADA